MPLATFTRRQFDRQKQRINRKLFKRIKPQLVDKPTGILLGGQPASGKTNLIETIKRDVPDRQFVVINGDEFRAYHPNYRAISDQYGTEAPHHTQPFSNALVEWAKNECLTKGYNFIVEGTMRNFSVIQNTVAELQVHGFRAELHALAIPRVESLLGIFDRYERDMTLTGVGRFSAIAVHDEAFHNIPVNLNRAARELAVDRSVIYRRDLANELITCIDTADLTNLDTVDFSSLFAQVRQPQRDAAFYTEKYEALRQSAMNRGETNQAYLAQLTALSGQLS